MIAGTGKSYGVAESFARGKIPNMFIKSSNSQSDVLVAVKVGVSSPLAALSDAKLSHFSGPVVRSSYWSLVERSQDFSV